MYDKDSPAAKNASRAWWFPWCAKLTTGAWNLYTYGVSVISNLRKA